MRPSHSLLAGLAAGMLAGTGIAAAPAGPLVVMETVIIGNPGNAGEQSRLPSADPTFYGGVAYTYAIGKYEVTAGQYTAFLNAVASEDTYGLYHSRMDYDADPSRNGCNIKRQGTPGSYTYSVAPDWANRPVNCVSWGDAARFVNWLHNGQPSGPQDVTTTEDGSYFLNGMTTDLRLENVVREPDATWVIPTENEWYKAAYHKNDGVMGNYWNFPTSADNSVSNALVDPDPGNNASFSVNQVSTIGPPYYRTEAGDHPIRDEARFLVELPEAGRVRIAVFDIAGRRVAGDIDRVLPAGANEVAWRTGGLAPGVYLARLTALGRSEVIRFVRLR